MRQTHYNEDTLVQQTTADYLHEALGWDAVYAYNQETFGPDGLLGRDSDREVLLVRYLREKLEELNTGLPQDAYRDAIRQIRKPAPARPAWPSTGINTDCSRTACRSASATRRAN